MSKLVVGLRPEYNLGNNPKDRIGDTKIDLTLVPPASTVFQAIGMSVGARKYGPYNWRVEPIRARGYLAAAMRHLQAVLDGQDFDPVEGVHHLAFAHSTIGIYIDAMVQGTLIDDRPIPGRGGELLDAFALTIRAGRVPKELANTLRQIVNSHRDDDHDLVVKEKYRAKIDA